MNHIKYIGSHEVAEVCAEYLNEKTTLWSSSMKQNKSIKGYPKRTYFQNCFQLYNFAQ
jgi:hypothetical protein